MDRKQLLQIRDTLLQGGIAYQHVRRFLGELRDHHEDLTQEAEKNGSDRQTAGRLAATRLGNPMLLVDEMLKRPELRSWGYRYPKTLLILGPLLSLVFAFVCLVLMLIGLSEVLQGFKGGSDAGVIVAVPAWVGVLLSASRFFLMYCLPLLVVVLFVGYAEKNRLPRKYYATGLVLASVIACSQYYSYTLPDPVNQIQGSIRITLDVLSWNFRPDYPIRLLSCLAAAWLSYLGVQQSMLRDLVRF